jgi:hypothetical protein
VLAARAAQAESQATKLISSNATGQETQAAASLSEFSAMYQEQAAEAARRPAIHKEGMAALTRLFEVV